MYINGFPVRGQLKKVFQILLLSCVHSFIVSADVIRRQVLEAISIMEDYCTWICEDPDVDPRFRRQSSVFRRRLQRLRAFWKVYYRTDQGAQQGFYDLILALEGLSVLHGFGLANQFGDPLHVNPERQSVYLRMSRR